MPFDKVFAKYKAGKLHSGGPSGPVVKDHNQAVAIYMSEKQKAEQGKQEYQPRAMKLAAQRRKSHA